MSAGAPSKKDIDLNECLSYPSPPTVYSWLRDHHASDLFRSG